MSKKKAAGKLNQQKPVRGKRLGVKVSDGKLVSSGSILVRQRGRRFVSGNGTKIGRDFTIYSIADGVVKFGQKLGKKVVSVVSK